MSVQISPIAPSLPATTAIQDPAVRQFANAVADALRAGQSPEATARVLVSLLGGGSVTPVGETPGGGGTFGRQTSIIINEILQSELFNALGRAIERATFTRTLLDKIRKLEAGFTSVSEGDARSTLQISAAVSRVGAAEAAIASESITRATEFEASTQQLTAAVSRIGASEAAILGEQATRATNESAIVTAVNTIWAMTGANNALVQTGGAVSTNWTATQANWWNTLQSEVFTSGGKTIRQAIAQEAVLRTDADGELYAQYTVKIDQNGYVSGFGLASESREDDTPYSRFIFRADSFLIASPAAPGEPTTPPATPFLVLTTPVTVDGVVVPPGVYIQDAFIKNASIDTLKIADEAVVIPRGASGTYSAQVTLVLPVPARMTIIGTFTQGTGRPSLFVALFLNGARLTEEQPIEGTTGAMSVTTNVMPAGTYTARIAADNNVGQMRCGLTVLAVQR